MCVSKLRLRQGHQAQSSAYFQVDSLVIIRISSTKTQIRSTEIEQARVRRTQRERENETEGKKIESKMKKRSTERYRRHKRGYNEWIISARMSHALTLLLSLCGQQSQTIIKSNEISF